MKNILLTLILVVVTTTSMTANEQDTLWYRFLGRDIYDVDFTPDDQFVIAWTQNLEFWDIETGTMNFHIPYIGLGDFNYNNELIVFSQDSTPKLIDWQTREITEGFVKEEYDFGRIKTAKSKNEFMADLIDDDNTIYFWDITQKNKLDSLILVNSFNKNGFNWKRRMIEYNYLGRNDEFIIVKYDDDNSVIDNIPPSEYESNFFYHIYNRESKELVDSLFVFQQRKDKYYFVDKMSIMNDRSKIAWNNEGGVINFYDFVNKKLLKSTDYQFSSSGTFKDIEFSKNDELMIIAFGEFIKIINMDTKLELSRFTVGTYYECSLANNKEMVVGSISSSLMLHPNILTGIHTPIYEKSNIIFPNPTNSRLKVDINTTKNANFMYNIFDLNSVLVLKGEIGNLVNGNNKISLNVDELIPNAYVLQIYSPWESFEYKFIKE